MLLLCVRSLGRTQESLVENCLSFLERLARLGAVVPELHYTESFTVVQSIVDRFPGNRAVQDCGGLLLEILQRPAAAL